MSDYEELTVKMRLIQLAQNQTLIDLLAEQVGTQEASDRATETASLLLTIKCEIEKYL